MKLAVAVAGKDAPPSAFVVWRGFDESIPKAADYGYHGIELALKNAEEINKKRLIRILNKYNLEVSCITTGQVFAVLGLYFTNSDIKMRRKAIDVFKGLIDLAKDFGKIINVGRARGSIGVGQSRKEAEKLFIDTIEYICDIAEKDGVTLVIEPATHHEINFINTLDECTDLLKKIRKNNVGIMPDIYHMIIEDKEIEKSLIRNGELIRYIHFLTVPAEVEIVERAQQIVTAEEVVLKALNIDTRSVWLKRPKNWEMSLREDQSYIDEWGITRRKSYTGLYFDPVVFPLKESEIEDLRSYSWPDPDDSERFKGLKEKARKIHRENRYPLIVDPTGSIPFQNAQSLRGFDIFLMDLLLNQKFAEALMDKILEFQIKLLKNLFNEIGTYIDVIKIADDLGAQNAPLISPELYRKLIKPRHRVLINFIKENTEAKILLHTDGDVYPLIKDFIEIGVDILNPIQISAHEMDPKRLKKEFGNELGFWGGIDSQEVLPHGSIQDVNTESGK